MPRYAPRHLAPAPSLPDPRRRHLFRTGAAATTVALGLGATLAASAAQATPAPVHPTVGPRDGRIHGQDVSGWQGSVDWRAEVDKGSRFAYVKATEGRTWVSDAFREQYRGAGRAGLVRGAYHFARPDSGDPVAQADHFLEVSGGWEPDGRTLPGVVDLEAFPGLPANYGLSRQEMRQWIADFSERYRSQTHRRPVLYTNRYWWADCVGEWTLKNSPLFLAAYSRREPTALPGTWWGWELWQYSDRGPFAGDSNVFFGTEEQFERFVGEVDYGAVGI
ncbi:lysozyme [Brachybacterium sp. EF45031]|uniref:GH25 family lysozyme n=1 Tax=Brachybacterium sillae TaxID=2810536 RepID=UPI00217ECEA4|nr:GH25 family lysozyme [Brachybacterium sillae]MCS6710635.1 lysozyme [Brachybacterium sillae]